MDPDRARNSPDLPNLHRTALSGETDGSNDARASTATKWQSPCRLDAGRPSCRGEHDCAQSGPRRSTPLFKASVAYAAGIDPRGSALGDLNGNAKLDLVITNAHGDSVSVFLGTGTGALGAKADFTTGTRPKFTAIDDFNGDGKADLAVVNQDARTASILLGTGTGSLDPKADVATRARS